MAEKFTEFKSSGWLRTDQNATPYKLEPPVAEIVPPVVQMAPPVIEIEPPAAQMMPPASSACGAMAMAHFDMQPWEAYDAETGIERGTVFPALDLPFVGKGACNHE